MFQGLPLVGRFGSQALPAVTDLQQLQAPPFVNVIFGTLIWVNGFGQAEAVPPGQGDLPGVGVDWLFLNPPTSSLIQSAPYDTFIVGTPANGLGGGPTSSEFVNSTQRYRLRQYGVIRQCGLYVAALPTAFVGWYLKIWRPSNADGSGVLTLVGQSENLATQISQLFTIAGGAAFIKPVLTQPIVGIRPGDIIGARWEGNDGITAMCRGHLLQPNTNLYFEFNGAPWTSGHAVAGAHVVGANLPILVYTTPCELLLFGDSVVQGLGINTAFTQTDSNITDLPQYWGQLVANGKNWTYQNLGHGSDNTDDLVARLASDVIAEKPRRIILEGGVNDIMVGGKTAAYVINNYSVMLTALQAAGITGYVLGILPDGLSTTPQARAIDTVNAWILANVATFGFVPINQAVTAAVGQFRPGGDPGNIWDIKPAFEFPDGNRVHYTVAGQAAIAAAILAQI